MRSLAAAAVGLILFPTLARAEIPLRAERVVTGTERPLFVTHAPGDPNRIYILEQRGSGGVSTSGAVRIYDYTTGSLTTFLTIPNVATGNEQGVLGMAFHPNYASNGLFYVNLTATGGQTQIRQYSRVDANTASTTFSTVLNINQPQSNHNGGWLGFGPNDGMLYIASGDGGNFDDQGTGHTEPDGNAQDLSSNLLGKMLRININGDDFPADATRNYSIPAGNPFNGTTGDREIWSYGLRNPWRNSFDRTTGDLYIGDVGQEEREEINYQPANSTGGENYGWRAKEGTIVTGLMPAVPDPVVDPIHEYTHAEGIAVTGGYVYRGDENDALTGTYFFADYGSARVWTFKYDGTTKKNFRELTGADAIDFGEHDLGLATSFGEDAQGRLYITDRDGDVFRLVPAFPGDANLDDFVDAQDLTEMAQHWNMQSGARWADGDFTDDGRVDARDLLVLANHWFLGPDALAAAMMANGLPADVVPEPAAAGVIVLGLLGRRRRR